MPDTRPVEHGPDIAVITGTTHGIGRVTSRELARAGRAVIMLCRDVPAALSVRADILARQPHALVQVVHCDLASLDSVRAAAAAVRRSQGQIALLINNAGTVSVPRRRTADGFELTFATNHLGPFLLTELLRPQLRDDARIINVASRAHFRGRLDFASVTARRGRYSSVAAYAQSKLANVLHTFALAQRLEGTRVSVNCLHPGVVASNLLPRWLRLIKPLVSEVIDVERGARTTLHLALEPGVAGVSGRYFDEHAQPQAASALAQDPALQEALWQHSAHWTGVLQ